MGYQAWFQCQKGCDERYSLYEVVYRCKKCGSLLEVAHDVDALRDRSAQAWKDLFDARYMRHAYPYGSAVWGKLEWVCPTIDVENIISMYEGGTNLFWAERLGRQIGLHDLWVKQCGNSHTGSFKDLGMTVLVSVVRQIMANGSPIKAVACASTGDTSASLAAYCAAAGIPCIVFLPQDKVSSAQLIQPIANGALVLSLETDFDGCMAIVQQVTQEHDIYLANSLNSLRIEGQKTTSIELVQQFKWEVPDVIIVPGGNLGNISALGRGFWMLKELGLIDRLPRLVCAQAERANPLYRSYLTGFRDYQPILAQQTLATAIQIGNPVSIDRAIRTLQLFDGIVEQATEEELANATARADLTGMYTCPHTGVALAVLCKLVERGEISPTDRVVVISTAHGLKFSDFKIAYHEERLQGITSRHANPPMTLPPNYATVMDAIHTRLKATA
jgi:threonine synthase